MNVDSVELDHRAIGPVTRGSYTRPTVHRDATHARPATSPLNLRGPQPLSSHGPH